MNPPTPEAFNALTVPLSGHHLIEASAGTGKTWSMAALYARLVLETGLKPENILVVTFTKAATGELRERIRRRLAELAAAFTGPPADEFCADLVASWLPRESATAAAERLQAAVSGFDAAAIYTIHGFCQRVLAEQALAAGQTLRHELLADESALQQAAFDSAWQTAMRDIPPAFARWLVDKAYSPDTWYRELRGHLHKPFQRVDKPAPVDLPARLARLEQGFAHASTLWQQAGPTAHDWVERQRGAKQLSGSSYRADYLKASWLAWDDWLVPGDPQRAPGPALAGDKNEKKRSRLWASTLNAALKTPAEIPPLFHALETLWQGYNAVQEGLQQHWQTLCAEAIPAAEAALQQRKQARSVMGFNDLLLELSRALQGEHGPALADTLRQQYRAALIDEFQDTDPLQFDIFRAVFNDPAHPLWLVGDPKQAIYRFRGADLFTYLQARAAIPSAQQHVLPTNRRSTPALVQAVSALFQQAGPQPFLLPGLDFPTVVGLPERLPLVVDGQPQPPLQWQWFESPPAKKDFLPTAARSTARSIATLLQLGAAGRARLGDAPLTGGDIAVLAASHQQLALLQRALQAEGIASVRLSQQSVFASPEAQDLLQVLAALADPRDSTVRTALATPLCGWSAARLLACSADDAAWEVELEGWRKGHALLGQHGPFQALMDWLRRSGVAAQLAEQADGERRLTNLLHLFEMCALLHTDHPGMAPLLAAYRAALLEDASGDADARQMRLESDAARVKLVTIHAAKGLEYPVVFCPCLWDGMVASRTRAVLACHEDDGTPVLDFGSPRRDERHAKAAQEDFSEKLRLLYVALTRPRAACIIGWGEVSGVQASPLGWLLAGGHFEAQTPQDDAAAPSARQRVDELLARNPDTMAWCAWPEVAGSPPAETPVAPLPAARLSRPLGWQWRMASFSSLSAGVHEEQPDHDLQRSALADDSPAAPEDAFARFPAGPQAGVCLHSIFEQWDFTRSDRAALEALCLRTLEAHGLEGRWAATAADLVANTLAAPVTPEGATLARLPAQQRRVELEFTFPLQAFRREALVRLLRDPAHGLPPAFAEAARTLPDATASGYLKGFIDLSCVFEGRYYVLDYKSNKLGPGPAHYSPQALEATMAAEHYYLQALIYALALHRYLGWRLPGYDFERHFGGASYLFLRGMSPQQPLQGVWFHRPSRGLMDALQNLLCDKVAA